MGTELERSRAVVAIAVLLALLGVAALATPSASAPASAESAAARGEPRPNIVFILADDQARNSFTPELMPRTFEGIVEPGIRFRRALAAPPLCCPYRAGFLTGQYPHNHGVTTNDRGYSHLRDPENVLPNWLRGAGYETALVGKYLNWTRSAVGLGAAPGWDEWFSIDHSAGYFDPDVDVDGEVRRIPGYTTDILADRAVEFIESRGDTERPFLLWLAQFGPHTEPRPEPERRTCPNGMPQPRAEDVAGYDGPTFAEVRSRSFDERDVTDKPAEIRELEPLSEEQKERISTRWLCTAATVRSVDDSVGRVISALRRSGRLRETIVVYGSDNGFMFGEHRIRQGKANIYEESLGVPLAIRLPAAYRGDRRALREARDRLVTQLDLTAGIVRWSRARPCVSGDCRRLDGLPLSRLVEQGRWGSPRAVLYELFPRCPERELGVRTSRFSYRTAPRGCRADRAELYDMARDPAQLESLAGLRRWRRLERELDDLTRRLARCSGVAGRDRRLPGRPFCR